MRLREEMGRSWRLVAGLEVAIAMSLVLLDVAIPTVVVLPVAALFLILRRKGWAAWAWSG